MNSAEKPFEVLTPSEKDVFKICSDIIAWNPGHQNGLEIMQLRERATALFKKMREVDLVYDDSYYKYIAEAKALEQEFNRLHKENLDGDVYIDSSFVRNEDDLNILVAKLLETSNTNTSARTFIYWVPQNQENPYTDYTSIQIRPEKIDGLFTLFLGELFDSYSFNSSPHIKTFYQSLNLEEKDKAEIQEHKHNDGDGPEETWLSIEELPRNHLQVLLDNFLGIIKANPRKKD